jgi:hypothetical protein
MPTWLTSVSPDAVWATVLALVLIGSVTISVIKVVHPITSKIVRVLDAFLGRPAEQGLSAIPGVIERLDSQDAKIEEHGQQLAQIKEQVTPNHGSTSKLSDDVQSLQKGLADLLQRFDQHLQH